MDKKFILIIVAIVALFGGVFYFNRNKESDQSSNNIEVTETSHTKGAGNKGVTLVEYGDFQCPACGGYYPIVTDLLEKYGDDLKFQFVHFPIDSIHPNARAAHRAAEAAGRQGKFFEMYDLLFQNQTSWQSSRNTLPIFEGYAQQIGLNMDEYNADYPTQAINDIINADANAGRAKGVNSTPTFFLNGTQLNNNDIRTIEQFTAVIDAEIAKSAAPQESADSNNQ